MKNKLILEFTEFNNLRLNSDNFGLGQPNVDDPNLSLNAFDKHQDGIRQAMSKINDILYSLKGTSAFTSLRSKMLLEDQDITGIRIQRIIKSNTLNYDVYLVLNVGDNEYWGVIYNILGINTYFNSEIFNDYDLIQTKEWVIKIKGLVIKTIKKWLIPDVGFYILNKDSINLYSINTSKPLILYKGNTVELIRSNIDDVTIKYEDDYFNLVGDNFVYFNWWFEKVI